jgi:phytanoyl-CoA hydroxylase
MPTPEEYYEDNGYYIFSKLIPDNLIDNILEKYKAEILSSNDYFFRQSSNRWEKSKITEHGYCKESFLNVHDYSNYPAFCEAAREIFCSQQIREALTQITGSRDHNLMQSMLFDLNAATPPHQDWYYLDSMPNGHLLAGWFALEDIYEEAGRFYILPKSNKVELDLTEDEIAANATYVKKMRKYVDSRKSDIYAPALKKGDVLFWNSRTVHGSSETQNPQYSRKSLTAHYLPSQYQSGSRYAKSPAAIDYGIYKGMKYALTPNKRKIYSPANKLRADFSDFVTNQPKLARMANSVREILKTSKDKHSK